MHILYHRYDLGGGGGAWASHIFDSNVWEFVMKTYDWIQARRQDFACVGDQFCVDSQVWGIRGDPADISFFLLKFA